jgi:hypothetical protein
VGFLVKVDFLPSFVLQAVLSVVDVKIGAYAGEKLLVPE